MDESRPPVFYTNHVQVGMSYFGLAMVVGTKRLDESVDSMCEVHMSPQHAKMLHAILGEHIKAYESKMGTISMPKAEAK